jgi:hypothetical protein
MYTDYARNGDLERMKLSISNGVEYDHYLHAHAAYFGQKKILEFLSTLHPVWTWDRYITKSAARGGQWEILQWLLDRKCHVDQNTVVETAKHGNLQMVQHLCYNYPEMELDDVDTSTIVASGHMNVNLWVEKHPERFEWDESLNYTSAAMRGSIEVIEWLHSKGYKWDSAAPKTALEKGHTAIVKWFEAHPESNIDVAPTG